MLEIKDLHAGIEGKEIIKGVNLRVNAGEVHAIMGPNGSGKSTLAKVIAGHPQYTVTGGTIEYEANLKKLNLVGMEPDERACEGVFMAFQYPVEIPGIPTSVFLRAAFNAICRHQGTTELDPIDFDKYLREKMKLLSVDERSIDRPVNVDFSGGEKKRNEVLQMAVLNPRLAVLDETDSGLDIDSMKIVAEGVNKLRRRDNAVILITHYQRLLNYIQPDFVHIFYDGKIVRSEGKELALEVENRGYDWVIK